MHAMEDTSLKAFLLSKGIEDGCAHVDRGFLQDVAEKMIHTNQYLSNEGDHQRAFAVVALVWGSNDTQRGITTGEMLDWLATGRGNMEYLVWNDIYADGFPNEASPGYSSAVSAKCWEIARYMKKAGYNLFSSPRMLATAHVWLDLTMCGRQQPAIGDYGSILGGARAGWDVNTFRWAWEEYGDPRFAKAIMEIGNPPPGLMDPDRRVEIAEAAEKHPGPVVAGTRNLSQFGCAILESRHTRHPRALSLYYGSAAGGHGHYDRLNIELYAHGRSMMPDLGYPDQWGPRCTHFHKNSTSHYVVQIDKTGQQTMARGKLHFIADLDDVQVVEAGAENVYPGTASEYRRTTALVDLSEEAFYVVDIFRVKGGNTHDWLWHGPPQEGLETEGLDLSDPRPGTLAGPDVALGKEPENDRRSGYQWLHNVREAKPAGAWSITHPPTATKAGLQMTMLPGCAQRVFATTVPAPQIKNADIPEELPWIVARSESSRMSTFVAVIRTLPATGKGRIEAIKPVSIEGDPDAAVALRITSRKYIDTIYSSTSPETPATVGSGLKLSCRFALERRERSGKLISVHTVGANHFEAPDISFAAGPAHEGTVMGVDPDSNTVSIAGFPDTPSLVGDSVVFRNPLHQTNFQIAGITGKDGTTVLGFGYVSLVAGRGDVLAVEDDGKRLLTDTLWRTHGTMDIWAPGFHPALEGMYLQKSGSRLCGRIEQCQLFPDLPKEWWQPEAEHGSIELSGIPQAGNTFEAGDRYAVHAVGEGDRAFLPVRVVLKPGPDGMVRVETSAAKLSLSIPGLKEEAIYKSTGKSQSATRQRLRGGRITLTDELAPGKGILIVDPAPDVDYTDPAPPLLTDLSLDGTALTYKPNMTIDATQGNRLSLTFTDANPILPPVVSLGGVRLDETRFSVRAENGNPMNQIVSLDLQTLVAETEAPEIAYPPVLTVAACDAAQNATARDVRIVFIGHAPPLPTAVFLSDLGLISGAAHGGVKLDTDYAGDPGQELRGEHFEKGIMTCPRKDGPAEAVFDLTTIPEQRRFRAIIGVEDAAGAVASVTFEVYVDRPDGTWRKLYTSDILHGQGTVKALSIDLGMATRLRLVVTDAGDSINSDHAVWADARLE
jgi:hypothetical protein